MAIWRAGSRWTRPREQAGWLHGTAPTADLEFTAQGKLRHAHLERGVAMDSQEQSEQAGQSQR